MGRHDGKTEKATPQRRREARREGTVARSQEVGTAMALLAAAGVLRLLGPHGIRTAAGEFRSLLGTPVIDGVLPSERLVAAAGRLAAALMGPLLAGGVLAAILAGVVQVGFRVTPATIKPKLSNLSPRKGLEKLKPATAGWELARMLLKLGLLLGVAWGPLTAWRHDTAARSLDDGVAHLLGEIWTLLVRVVALAVVLAAADYAHARWKTNRQLRMSKQDLKQEHRNSEGDPQLRARRRQRAQELSRNRMLGDVVTADAVVTNPTHLAVALRYGRDDGAPRVVAKGADRLAARIRAEAHRHGVPLTEDKPLARAIYREVDVGQYVPAALYEAVAAVLATAYRRSGRLPAGLVRQDGS